MIADIFITHKPNKRNGLVKQSLYSLFENTDRSLYRLTMIIDGGHLDWVPFDIYHSIDYVIESKVNAGLGPSINQALAHIDALKKWDGKDASPFTLYLQDDIQYSPGWLEKLTKMFLLLERQHNLGFASGIECIEHPMKKDLGNGMILKDWIRATCMLARHEYWMSMWPIPKIDVEIGRERGKPNDGLGSGVDWHFIRVHENSVCKTGKTNLVIPGLLQHIGYDQSTWLARELPESEEDKKKMK